MKLLQGETKRNQPHKTTSHRGERTPRKHSRDVLTTSDWVRALSQSKPVGSGPAGERLGDTYWQFGDPQDLAVNYVSGDLAAVRLLGMPRNRYLGIYGP